MIQQMRRSDRSVTIIWRVTDRTIGKQETRVNGEKMGDREKKGERNTLRKRDRITKTENRVTG
jgi:hypothetical protein